MMLLSTPAPSLPIGAMIAYAGLIADIPTGWALCDGENGTPDLRNKFVMACDHADNGLEGGSHTVTPSGSVSVSASVHNHTLSQSQMPSHQHLNSLRDNDGGYHAGYGYQQSSGNHVYWSHGIHNTIHGVRHYVSGAGGSGAHSHGISASGSLNANSQDNRPAYYQTAYIMRVS